MCLSSSWSELYRDSVWLSHTHILKHGCQQTVVTCQNSQLQIILKLICEHYLIISAWTHNKLVTSISIFSKVLISKQIKMGLYLQIFKNWFVVYRNDPQSHVNIIHWVTFLSVQPAVTLTACCWRIKHKQVEDTPLKQRWQNGQKTKRTN